MAVNSQNIYLGKPDQLTTGAVSTAAVGTAAPTDAGSVLSGAWTDSGYVNEDGVTVTLDRSTTDIKDWSGSTVRVVLDEFSPTVKYAEMETTYETMCRLVGESNIVKTDATDSAGTKMKVAFGPDLPPALAFCFSMKDGNRRVRIFIPNGQITEVDDISFKRDEAIVWSFTVKCNDDGTGHSIYLFTDDGVANDTTEPEIVLNHASRTVQAGSNVRLSATTKPAGQAVTWTSSDTDKATVSNGVVHGEAAGSATITAKITVDGNDYTDTCAVTVTAASA